MIHKRLFGPAAHSAQHLGKAMAHHQCCSGLGVPGPHFPCSFLIPLALFPLPGTQTQGQAQRVVRRTVSRPCSNHLSSKSQS